MTEQEMRALVREAIATQAGRAGADRPDTARPAGGWVPATFLRAHLSHAQFDVGPGPDGTCIIEPSVMCNHCGYCKSYGH